jgi:hypothetical protein
MLKNIKGSDISPTFKKCIVPLPRQHMPPTWFNKKYSKKVKYIQRPTEKKNVKYPKNKREKVKKDEVDTQERNTCIFKYNLIVSCYLLPVKFGLSVIFKNLY